MPAVAFHLPVSCSLPFDSALPLILVVALVADAAIGDPDWMVRRIGHPVIWMGALIRRLDLGLNREDWGFARRRAAGVLALATLVGIAGGAGWVLAALLADIPGGDLAIALVAATLLAQKSLRQHVAAVDRALSHEGIDAGRQAVARIVGRDVAGLDEAGVRRAAIESLAENFSDGVVAPVLWLAVGGLPGLCVYKAASTADSMIGHRSPRHHAFGWAAARLDDLLNWPAARLAALLIALGAGRRARAALAIARRDGRRHLSPNAGWPEAAMAGALSCRLKGPRLYAGRIAEGEWLGDGPEDPGPQGIARGLRVAFRANGLLWLAAFALAGMALAAH